MKRMIAATLFCAGAAVAFSQAVDSSGVVAGRRGSDYSAPTASERAMWVARGTVGVPNLAAGLVTAGWGTWSNSPKEYGSHWDGFGKRYGLRLTAGATGRTMEAGLGSLWGEDPRYMRATGQPLKNRLGHVFKMTFMATDRTGATMPAYARYIAVPSNSFLSNAWRPDSNATPREALERIPIGFLDRFIGNAFAEFWPDLRKHMFKFRQGD